MRRVAQEVTSTAVAPNSFPRIIRHGEEYNDWRAVHLVYFDAVGSPFAIDTTIAGVSGETLVELMDEYAKIDDALNHQEIDFSIFKDDTMRIK